jgi:undecaprenyl-diphosphatase
LNLLQAAFFGVLQGATEFLPVSSSGHLVLVPCLLGLPSPSLAFDAVVHCGTAVAVVVYFRSQWVSMSMDSLRWIRGIITSRSVETAAGPAEFSDGRVYGTDVGSWGVHLVSNICFATVPAALIGWRFDDFFEKMFGQPRSAALFLLVTAIVLVVSERWAKRDRTLWALTWGGAACVGLAQAFAILPGISRSGATMAAGLLWGLREEDAARFSFLVATPTILGAGLLKLGNLAAVGDLSGQLSVLIVGVLTAGVVGWVCIDSLMRYLQRRRLSPFAAYCAAVGLLGILCCR